MSTGHHHHHDHAPGTGREGKLWMTLALTAGFMLAEIVGGLLTNSLALLSDAAHMFTDAAALAVSLAAIRVAKRAADHKRTFGYYRFEILAAAYNAAVLFLVAGYILYEAYKRFVEPPQVQALGMLAVAAVGLVVNLIGMSLLRGGSAGSLNVKGAYLEVWSDMLGSVGVIVAAVVIRFTGWTWVDPLVAVGIGLWVLPRTWTLLKESINILLEGVPGGLKLDEIEQALLAVPGVGSVHDLHVWALTSGKNSLTVHLVCDGSTTEEQELLRSAAGMLAARFGITHATIQVETGACVQASVEPTAHFRHR